MKSCLSVVVGSSIQTVMMVSVQQMRVKYLQKMTCSLMTRSCLESYRNGLSIITTNTNFVSDASVGFFFLMYRALSQSMYGQ